MKLKAALLVLTLSEYFVELGVIKLIQLARGVKESNPYLVVRYFFFSSLMSLVMRPAFLTHIARYSLSCAYERKTLYTFILF